MKNTSTTFLADTFPLPFRGRAEAGVMLAGRLKAFANQRDAIVVAVANGGVPVGTQIASILNLPLKVQVVRRLEVPGHEELSLGMIATEGTRIVDQEVTQALHLSEKMVESVIVRETQELRRRERMFARDPQKYDLKDKTVILVDDAIECESGMLAAIQAVRKQGAKRIVVAVPVGAKQNVEKLREVANQIICLVEPKVFFCTGHWYDNFQPVADWEVCQLLDGQMERTSELQLV